MSDHAKFSPSAAHRWKACPASVRESENTAPTDSEASREGTAGHWAYAMALMGKPVEPGATAPNGVKVTIEMLELVGEAVGWVKGYLDQAGKCTVMVEERVQVGDPYYGLDPDLFWGTADTIILAKDEMVIVDLKMGWVDVQAERNSQLGAYAVGAAEELGWLWEKYKLVILQPKQGEPKVWEVSRSELQAFADELREPIANALSPEPRYKVTEEGCRYCPAAARCKALHAEAIVLAQREFSDPAELVKRITVEQMAELLEKSDLIRGVLAAVEEHALSLIMLGKEVPGWKAVEGRKNRIWKPGAEEIVAKHLGEKAFAPPKLISPAQAEKMVAKRVFDDLIEKPKGEPRLAAASDKRPALPPHFDEVDMGDVLS